MPIVHKDIPIAAADMTDIKASFTKIKDAIKDQQVNITAKERGEISTLGDVRYPFAMRTVVTHAPNNPKVVPPFRPLADAQDSLTLYNQFAELIPLAKELVALFEEGQQLPGHNLYAFLRGVYELAIAGDEAGLEGADIVVADIAPLFAGQGGPGGPTPPPAG